MHGLQYNYFNGCRWFCNCNYCFDIFYASLGLALRAIYIIGVNAGLANKKPTIKTKTPPKQTQAEPKKPIRVDGDKVIYNEDPSFMLLKTLFLKRNVIIL